MVIVNNPDRHADRIEQSWIYDDIRLFWCGAELEKNVFLSLYDLDLFDADKHRCSDSGNSAGFRVYCQQSFPTATGRYWYATAYFILVLLSPYLNLLVSKADKKTFR